MQNFPEKKDYIQLCRKYQEKILSYSRHGETTEMGSKIHKIGPKEKATCHILLFILRLLGEYKNV